MDAKQIIENIDKLVFFKDFTAEEKADVASFTHNFILYRDGDLIVQQESNDPLL